jgi:hypothetical protein
MFHKILITAALLATPVAAQDVDYIMPKIPTEAEKVEALKLAYALNGNSMVGPTIDLTDPKVLEAYRNAIAGTAPNTIIEDSGPGIWPKLEKPTRSEKQTHIHNVCTAHGMYKQYYGTTWRCKR